MKNFAITGVAGFVAPRHLAAIRDTGNRIAAALDPHDAVGVLDRYSTDVRFFTEFERFDRHLSKLQRAPENERVHYLSVCSPNYLHDAHIRLALRLGATAICEKPLVINPWNLDALAEIEQETGGRVYTVLQLRLHPALVALRERLLRESPQRVHDVELTYVTMRGSWYHTSWKGSTERSGGLATNIGIHYFDMLVWLFGRPTNVEVHVRSASRVAGYLEFSRARVRWYLSIEGADLPKPPQPGINTTYRSITVDGDAVEFTEGFGDLHTRVYEQVLAGHGLGIDAARPSIELAHDVRTRPARLVREVAHPFALRQIDETSRFVDRLR